MEYFDKIRAMLDEVEATESNNILTVAKRMSKAIVDKKAIYIFGASHAGILSEELFYRAGGLMNINPIWGEDLSLSLQPITHTSRMEQLEGYGTIIASRVNFKKGDVLIVHSVSGRNAVSIDLAIEAKKAGVFVVVLTNLTYSKEVSSRHSSGKKLYETADICIDNHGVKGDACCEILGMEQKVAPTSTVIGATILNSIVVETVRNLVEGGMEHPPVFYSANLDGGDKLNRELFEKYADSIHYKL